VTPGRCHIRSDWRIQREDIGRRHTGKNRNAQKRRDRVSGRKNKEFRKNSFSIFLVHEMKRSCLENMILWRHRACCKRGDL